MFGTVLIANRGEIALRVARTCRELGIRTIAVYSDPDRGAAPVRFADDAVHIGPGAARRSYLNSAAIIQAALQTGADAIHPGYGFLSEEADFAEACALHGLTFIGPPHGVIATFGDKMRGRAAAAAAGVPVLPGSAGQVNTVTEARRTAGEIGYPVILKAVAGGGGIGMAVVPAARELTTRYATVCAGAQAAFGDPRVYIEKYLPHARHIEVQVLADAHGRVAHLGARDCSVQRRRQKLIEESPPAGLPPGLTERLSAAAVALARHVGYVGAGTFEFLVAGDRFYFIEANCRIQVEHPVTEMVTGTDLVREQLGVAAGDHLSFDCEGVPITGASIECRINAEDPVNDFRPTPGLISDYRPPGGPFTRVDGHVHAGLTVPREYDSLLAKLIVWAPDRPQAIARMDRALSELVIIGPGLTTTRDYLRAILSTNSFRRARHTTALVDELPPFKRRQEQPARR